MFFGEVSYGKVRKFQQREHPPVGVPRESCTTNLFFGFFFDGTKNNYVEAEAGLNHSNVVRLYDCFPGESVPGVLPRDYDWKHEPKQYRHFFKVYVPGVASPFKDVGDTGDSTLGAVAGAFAERRIVWALLQAINNVHRYFLKAPLISTEQAHSLVRRITLNKHSRALMVGHGKPDGISNLASQDTRIEFEEILKRLHRALTSHWPNKKTGRPAKIDPAIVRTIYISAFGFSRGATQARAFLNWLQSLCKLDAQLVGARRMSLGGFPVVFDFMGLFDTVASIGSANTYGYVDGHGGWADTEDSLRIPPGVKCVHIIAAHELRRSFPVDSISVRGQVPDGCQEIVVPGVHSDIGSGYCPREQGRGLDPHGADMLARIPLIMMYKEARLSGVPLKLEHASPVAKARFSVKTETIKAFNAYIAECKASTGPLHLIMREQARKQMEWRLARRIGGKNPLDRTESFRRATVFDQNDLRSAGLEFEEEIKKFLEWRAGKGRHYKPARQKAGFNNDRLREWEEIATWWDNVQQPSSAVIDLFDNYVHDSRAWFKLSKLDNEKAMRAALVGWGKEDPDDLTENQRQAAREYARTGKIPRMITGDRESYDWSGAGYLRFRKIYGGLDTALLSAVPPSDDRISATG
jgi:hypothetical protein